MPDLPRHPLHALRDLEVLWRQSKLPVILRQEGQVLVWLPWQADNRLWLRGEHRHRPLWLPYWKCWQVPQSWFEDICWLACQRYGRAYVAQAYRERETCAPACWNATGIDCTCSCLGAHHGQGEHSGAWYVVSDTCAVRWQARQFACRLITRKDLQHARPPG